MPSTIVFEFGDIVLVPFPFTDQSSSKRRPAVIVCSAAYLDARPDVILAAVTSQPSGGRFGEVAIESWQEAGLRRPSVVKPVLTTIDGKLVLRKLGCLAESDRRALRASLEAVLGS